VIGLNGLEAKSLKSLNAAADTRAAMAMLIFSKSVYQLRSGTNLQKRLSTRSGQGYRIWASDGGSLTPWRLEFYLRDAGVKLCQLLWDSFR
jgi:hypothetical protein